jgi:hypothetical protein
LAAKKLLKTLKNFSLFVAGNIRFAFPESDKDYNTKLSNGYQLGIGTINELHSISLKSEVFYRSLTLKDKLAEFDQSEAGIVFSIIHSFIENNGDKKL